MAMPTRTRDEMREYQRARRARLKAGTWPTAPKDASPVARRPALAPHLASERTAIEGTPAGYLLPASPPVGSPRSAALASPGAMSAGSTPAIGGRPGPGLIDCGPGYPLPPDQFATSPYGRWQGQRRNHAGRPGGKKRRARTAHRDARKDGRPKRDGGKIGRGAGASDWRVDRRKAPMKREAPRTGSASHPGSARADPIMWPRRPRQRPCGAGPRTARAHRQTRPCWPPIAIVGERSLMRYHFIIGPQTCALDWGDGVFLFTRASV